MSYIGMLGKLKGVSTEMRTNAAIDRSRPTCKEVGSRQPRCGPNSTIDLEIVGCECRRMIPATDIGRDSGIAPASQISQPIPALAVTEIAPTPGRKWAGRPSHSAR